MYSEQAWTLWAVALADESESLELVFFTDELAERLAGLEFTLGEGPAHDSAASEVATLIDDLSDTPARDRWPLFSADAVTAGVRAVHAFPLMSIGRSLGAVSMYRKAPGALSPDQHRHAATVTELIGWALLNPVAATEIGSALPMKVQQAAGMIMVQADANISDALALLKATAFAEDRPITEVAAAIVAGDRRFPKMEIIDDTR